MTVSDKMVNRYGYSEGNFCYICGYPDYGDREDCASDCYLTDEEIEESDDEEDSI